jgi:hypothetical protein
MNNLTLFFQNAWRWTCELPEIETQNANAYGTAPGIEEIKKSQYSEEFVNLMNNRMVMGFFRYGPRNKRSKYNNILSAEKRIALYKQTGNLECLVDVANMLRMEFENPQHPLVYFKAEDDGEHCV